MAKIMERAREIVRPLVRDGKPVNARKLQAEHSISHVTFEAAVAVERAWLEGASGTRVTGMTRPIEATGPFPYHPFADCFPLIEGDELEALAADIAANGLVNAIVLHDDMILDGRNREKACEKAGIAPRYEVYEGDDPLGFVISLNIKRRHLDTAQLASAGANMANMRQGERTDRPSAKLQKVISQADAAAMLGVSVRTVATASAIIKASEEVADAVFKGRVTLATAIDIVDLKLDDGDLKQLLSLPTKADIERNTARFKKDKRRDEVFQRIQKEAQGTAPEWPTGRFSVFYADPPWEDDFGPTGREVERHYPIMPLDDIMDLPVASIATDDAVLFLWALPHMLPKALAVAAHWGFEYRTNMVWVKDKIGLGQWARQKHEILIVARRGEFPPPPEHLRVPSVFQAPVGEHSAKPDIFAEMIERWYPTMAKIELFRRGPRPGWRAWGWEAGAA
jgi:N6-adenosine-specific RNA methylase IME4